MKKLILFYLLFISSIIISQTVPVITIQPKDQNVDFGKTSTFSVRATYHRTIQTLLIHQQK